MVYGVGAGVSLISSTVIVYSSHLEPLSSPPDKVTELSLSLSNEDSGNESIVTLTRKCEMEF